MLLLNIAGIQFTVSSKTAMTLHEPDPAYQSFIGTENACTIKIATRIDLGLENIPKTRENEKIFDSQQSWSMYRTGEGYCLNINSPQSINQPFILVQMPEDFSEASVYCSQEFIQQINGRTVMLNPLHYPVDQIMLIHIMSMHSGALFHAAGFCHSGKSYIVLGKSGAGKSTLSRLFMKRRNIKMLSDDRIIVRKIDGTFHAFGTPWPGDAGIAENKSCTLEGMFFLYHGTENMIRKISSKEAVEKIMTVTSIPWYDENALSNILLFCEDLVTHIPAYDCYFAPDGNAIELLENFVS